MKEYDHKEIEPKWQKYWEKKKVFEAKEDPNKKKFFGLIEFPYPSGDGLHVGHIRSNTAMDIITRKRRAEGYEVLYPIGWDAFGLPTENYAIKTGIHPTIVTKNNTDKFRKQLKALGFGFDWEREVNTTDPEYYKWTQWIFLKFLEKGLAYKKKMAINWCPKDKIGLANEEVIDGKCERCGTAVEKREKEQWMLAITKYAERLDKDLDKKKILIGTRNPSKVKMIKTCLADVSGIELVTFDDIPHVDDSGLVEGDDYLENAKMKSDFYFKKTGIPTISTDHILWIEKWSENNGFMVHIRKHANPNSPRATDEEVLVFLRNFLKSIGGSSKANFHYAISFADENGAEVLDVVPGNYVMQQEETKFSSGFPVDAMLKDINTGKFRVDEVEAVRYKMVTEAINKKLISKIVSGGSGVDYLEKIRIQQKNWIGKSQGMIFSSPVKDTNLTIETFSAHFEAFCADTFVVIAPDHPLLPTLLHGVKNADEIMKFAKELLAKRILRGNDEEKESEGIFTGRYTVDPVGNGDLPIWISSYALADYGTGIVKCSAHDERDFKFAKKYNIKLKTVLYPKDSKPALKVKNQEICFTDMGNGVLTEPKEFDGKVAKQERQNIINYLEAKKLAKATTTFKLRDWVFSRQRYWGEPIPVIHCDKCGIVPVPEKDLPVELPSVENYKPTDNGESPLAAISNWVNVKCPKCKSPAKRETDTMPNWAGSSWYYLRYTDAKNKKAFASQKALEYWTPVDWYNGGMEHTTLHLLYSRFWHKFLFDLGLVPTSEPYIKRTSHGLILGEGGVKMSKSLGNVVNPDQLIETFGADTLRLYEMFMGPFDQPIAWSTESMVGPRRFLERVWRIQEKVDKTGKEKNDKKIDSLLNKTIKKVGEDIENLRFNTAVSSMMVLLNEFEKQEKISLSNYKIYLHLLAPFAPHICEELWEIFGGKKSIGLETWPSYDEKMISSGTGLIIVQVNGKVRAELADVDPDLSEEEIFKKAFELQEVSKWFEGKEIKKKIYVKGKLINIVV